MSDEVDALIETARTWRRLNRLVVTHMVGDREVDDEVRLGNARNRWKRVATQLAAMDVVAARGFCGDEIVGAWSLPEEPEPDPEVTAETSEMKAHRAHTRWCFEEARRSFELNQKLTTSLVGVVIDLMRKDVGGPGPSPTASTEDQSNAAMMLLLQNMMANRGANDGAEETRSSGGDTGGQGSPREPAAAGT